VLRSLPCNDLSRHRNDAEVSARARLSLSASLRFPRGQDRLAENQMRTSLSEFAILGRAETTRGGTDDMSIEADELFAGPARLQCHDLRNGGVATAATLPASAARRIAIQRATDLKAQPCGELSH